jgi:hypothetical protein
MACGERRWRALTSQSSVECPSDPAGPKPNKAWATPTTRAAGSTRDGALELPLGDEHPPATAGLTLLEQRKLQATCERGSSSALRAGSRPSSSLSPRRGSGQTSGVAGAFLASRSAFAALDRQAAAWLSQCLMDKDWYQLSLGRGSAVREASSLALCPNGRGSCRLRTPCARRARAWPSPSVVLSVRLSSALSSEDGHWQPSQPNIAMARHYYFHRPGSRRQVRRRRRMKVDGRPTAAERLVRLGVSRPGRRRRRRTRGRRRRPTQALGRPLRPDLDPLLRPLSTRQQAWLLLLLLLLCSCPSALVARS